MAKTPKLPDGVSLYKDRGGSGGLWRVRLGKKFLGTAEKPIKRAFTAHADAVEWIRTENERLYGKLVDFEDISPAQVAELKVALAKMAGRASIVDAADAWLRYVGPFLESPTVANVASQVVEAKKSAGVGDTYAEELANKFALYFDGYLEKRMCDFCADDLEAIMNRDDERKKSPSQAQRAKRLRYARILIRFAQRKGWSRGNPLAVDPPKVEKSAVVVLSPKQVALLLIATQEFFPTFLAALAIKVFGGPRNTEIMKLPWSAVADGEVTLPAAFTKTGRLRGFEIHPTLAAWLDLCRDQAEEKVFPVPPGKKATDYWQNLLKASWVAAGFKAWPQNALRHAFCSYHFALHKDENLTAAIAGNSPAVIRANYVNAVKKKDCEQFWRLTPEIAEALATPDPLPVDGPDKEEPEPPPEES